MRGEGGGYHAVRGVDVANVAAGHVTGEESKRRRLHAAQLARTEERNGRHGKRNGVRPKERMVGWKEGGKEGMFGRRNGRTEGQKDRRTEERKNGRTEERKERIKMEA
jgi:hypothetical protein